MAAVYNLTQLAADVPEIVQRERDPTKIVAAAESLVAKAVSIQKKKRR